MDKKRVILLTGASDGIGKASAFDIAKKGHKLILLCRNKAKCEKVRNEIINATGNDDVYFVIADLSSQKEIKRISKEVINKFPDLNVLIHNAGVFMRSLKLTEDGIEMTFAVNHLAPFLLTKELFPLLVKNQPSKIVVVSSMAHGNHINWENIPVPEHYDGYEAYSLSKLGNILFTYELARRISKKGYNITVNCLHPGVINTKLLAAGWGPFGAPLEEGAKNVVYVALSPETDEVSGKYYFDRKPKSSNPITYDEEVAKKFWELSEKLIGEKFVV